MENQNVKRIEPFMPQQPFVRPIDMTFGPDGALYVIEYGDTWGVNPNSRIVRIDYVTGNRAPVVVASAANNIGKQPLEVKLSSQGTLDKDADDKLSYEWRVLRALAILKAPPSPARVVSREANPTVRFDEAGVYTVELLVTDLGGASRAVSVPVLVGNERPSIKFVEPRTGDFFEPNSAIPFKLYVKDPEDGTSDFDEAERDDFQTLDSRDVPRVTLNAVYSTEAIPRADGAAVEVDQGPAGMRLMKKSDCFNCHAVDQKRVGPPLLEVANKYRGRGCTGSVGRTSIEGIHGRLGQDPYDSSHAAYGR